MRPTAKPPRALAQATSSALMLAPLLLLVVPTTSAGMQDAPRPGFGLSELPSFDPTFASNPSLTLSSGRVAAFDGLHVQLFEADGSLLQTLASLPSFAFPGCLAVDPGESFLLVGESSSGNIYRVELDTGGMQLLAQLPFNYDAVFDSAGTAIVSAAIGGFGAGNQLIRLDSTSGATVLLADLPGPSGPLALLSNGVLIYGTQSDTFPPPPASTDLIYYLPSQLTGGALLGDGDAFLLAAGFDGASDLLLDPGTDALYLAENNFSTGSNRIYRVGPSATSSELLLQGAPFFSIRGLEFNPGTGAATFQAFQPEAGGELRYSTTDYFSASHRRAIRPARPSAVLSGAGLTGAGPVHLEFGGVEPSGTVLLLYGPQALYNPQETAHMFGGIPAPVHSGLDLGSLGFLPFFFSADSSGKANFSFHNPGWLQGLFTLQGLVGGAAGGTLGTTAAILL